METLDLELGRLAEAVALQGANPALMKAIGGRGPCDRANTLGSSSGSVKAAIADVREFALKQPQQIRSALQSQHEAARFELSQHVDHGIVLRPTACGDERFYTAEGEWNLLGKCEGQSPVTALRNLEMVAGADLN